jgi:hypothetical protein
LDIQQILEKASGSIGLIEAAPFQKGKCHRGRADRIEPPGLSPIPAISPRTQLRMAVAGQEFEDPVSYVGPIGQHRSQSHVGVWVKGIALAQVAAIDGLEIAISA